MMKTLRAALLTGLTLAPVGVIAVGCMASTADPDEQIENAEQAAIAGDAGAPVPPMGCQNLVGMTCILGSNLPYECCKPGEGNCVPDFPGGAIGRCMLGGG